MDKVNILGVNVSKVNIEDDGTITFDIEKVSQANLIATIVDGEEVYKA